MLSLQKTGEEGRTGSAWKRGRWRGGGERGGEQGREKAQTMYTHMNKFLKIYLILKKNFVHLRSSRELVILLFFVAVVSLRGFGSIPILSSLCNNLRTIDARPLMI
jgi:hypothetical protein